MAVYRLLFIEPEVTPSGVSKGAAKDVGEDVFFDNLPADYKVFLFYYPAEMPDPRLESTLRRIGESAGKNLFLNIGRYDDPKYGWMVERFGIRAHPVIVITAVGDLASPKAGCATTFVRLDSKALLNSPEQTGQCVQQLFDLFLQGKVADAASKAKWSERKQLAGAVANAIVEPLKKIGGFIASRDISVSVLEGKFEIKR